MADITGALHHTFEGKTYALRLTPRGLARLQADHGLDLGGVLSKGYEGTPPFGVLGGIVTEALKKGEGLDEDAAADLADDMLQADLGLASQVLHAAFPSKEGNGKAAGKTKR